MADLHLSRASKLQRWEYIKYAIPIISSAPGIVKNRLAEKGGKFEFPSKIRFMQETREKREKIRSILKKIAAKSRLSQAKAASEILPFVRTLLSSGNYSIAKYYELDKEEISVLLANGDARHDIAAESPENKEVKEPVKASEKNKKGKMRN